MDSHNKRKQARRYLEQIKNGSLTPEEFQELQELLKTKFREGDPEIVNLVERLAKYRNKVKWEGRLKALLELLITFLAELISKLIKPL